jgi:hypothetical protein
MKETHLYDSVFFKIMDCINSYIGKNFTNYSGHASSQHIQLRGLQEYPYHYVSSFLTFKKTMFSMTIKMVLALL